MGNPRWFYETHGGGAERVAEAWESSRDMCSAVWLCYARVGQEDQAERRRQSCVCCPHPNFLNTLLAHHLHPTLNRPIPYRNLLLSSFSLQTWARTCPRRSVRWFLPAAASEC